MKRHARITLSQSTTEDLQRLLTCDEQATHLAGSLCLIQQYGRDIFYHATGYASLEEGIPLRRDHIFRLFSLTKPLTALAVMQLVERGYLDLLAPLATILPAYAGVEEQEAPVTIRDLLQMTSGFAYPDGPGLAGEQCAKLMEVMNHNFHMAAAVTTQDFACRAAQLPKAFAPGSDFLYGISADILGAVIETVSGERLGDYLQEQIFRPLAMPDTSFGLSAGKRERLCQVYKDREPYHTNYLGISLHVEEDPSFQSAGAGLLSTIDDYARFTSFLLTGQRPEILSERALRHLLGAELPPRAQHSFELKPHNRGFTYGYLLRRLLAPERAGLLTSPGEYGWDGWLGCYFANLPQQGLSFLFMTQEAEANQLTLVRKLRNVLARDIQL